MFEVGHAEAALDLCQLFWKEQDRSFRPADRLIAPVATSIGPATAAKAMGGDSLYWRGLVHIH